MRELTVSSNEIAKFMLKTLAPTLPDAHIGKAKFYDESTRH